MADILGSLFGGGQRQRQQTTVDPTTQALNTMRYGQLQDLFQQAPLWQFGESRPDLYQPTDAAGSLLATGMAGLQGPTPFSLEQYLAMAPGQGLLPQALQTGADITGQAAANVQGGTQTALENMDLRLAGARADLNQDYALAQQASAQRFADALAMGLGGAQSFMNRVATPQIMQQMALQGLEGGGAVPEALARAGAEVTMPFLQTLLPAYSAEQAGLSQADMQMLQALDALGISTGAGLMGQGINTVAGLQGQQLGQAGNLFGTAMPLQQSFVQSIPGAAATLAQGPAQAALTRSQAAATLFPLADYPRSLAAEDFARRQGVAMGGFTGIPYTPETDVRQRTSQQPLFNFFGQA